MIKVNECPHIALQQIKHALLCDLFALVKLLQSLFDFVVLHFPLTLFLVVKVQASALHLLQMVLQWREKVINNTATVMNNYSTARYLSSFYYSFHFSDILRTNGIR